jgi:hypothetical protein
MSDVKIVLKGMDRETNYLRQVIPVDFGKEGPTVLTRIDVVLAGQILVSIPLAYDEEWFTEGLGGVIT